MLRARKTWGPWSHSTSPRDNYLMHPRRKTLLVVDDDRILCETLRASLESEDLSVIIAHTAGECLAECSGKKTDVVLLDQKLPDREGYTLCPEILSYNDRTKIIFCTAFPSFDNAVIAIRAGAYNYLSKPFEIEELRLALTHALRTIDLERIEQVQNYRNDKEVLENILVGSSVIMAEVKRMVDTAAEVEAPVLITGETGTGKNLVAQSIHYRGRDAKAPFISVNCASLPENLIEAELFGHERGAFTGAVATRKGVFEMAEGGTLFLDEIGEMPMHLQTKLLGVLDNRKVKRLGGETIRHVDARIIAATSIDVGKAIQEKTFREDLYYRLSVMNIQVPPLRERQSDVPEICAHLLSQVARGSGIRLSEEEMVKLAEYPWPGNIRELRNILERAVIVMKGQELRPSSLLDRRMKPRTNYGKVEGNGPSPTLDEVEKQYILDMLRRCSGNFTHTAKAMGISLSTLKRRLKRYGIS
jgi:DNA-binding NtrC family response regulator